MLNHRHKKFILTPVSIYIEDCIDAISNVEDGIESFSLGEYIMQSLFMKMTGAQEQKMKCICWELATVDYNFRREFLKEKATEGFSTLESKTFVYKSLINFLSEYEEIEEIKSIMHHEGIISSLKNDFIPMLESSILPSWHQRAFDEMKDVIGKMDNEYFALLKKSDKGELVGTLLGQKKKGVDMIDVYNNHLYVHRNRCAHNTKSYQEEQPSLKSMTTSGYNYENYFLWYAILIIIDSVMINLYKAFLEVPVL